jgi:hypothetical protein
LHTMPPHADEIAAYIVDWGIWSKRARAD